MAKDIDKTVFIMLYSKRRRRCDPTLRIDAAPKERTTFYMTLCEELYFEITLKGSKSDLQKFASFLRSGELDEFFEINGDYIFYADNFDGCEPADETRIVLSNDDYGIEIDELDVDEFLDVFCRAARALDVSGQLYDIYDEEYRFVSEEGDSYYLNAKNVSRFNEDEDLDEDE